jgi:hypothetical protein
MPAVRPSTWLVVAASLWSVAGADAGQAPPTPVPDPVQLRAEYDAARRLAAGIDPGLTALRDCDRAVRNASGAPWTVGRSKEECAARESEAEQAHPQLKGSVQACWAHADRALDLLEQANAKYEEARRNVDPRRGQLVQEGRAFHTRANEEIKQCAACQNDVGKLAAQIGQALLASLQLLLDNARRTGSTPPGDPRTFPPGFPGTQPGNGRTASPSSPSPLTACVAISDGARQRLEQLAGQLQPWWQANLDATGEFFGGLAQLAWDDFLSIARLGLGAFDRYSGAADPGGQVIRDIEGGVLTAGNVVGGYLTSEDKMRTLDPLRLAQQEVDRYKELLRRNPGRGAAEILRAIPIPGCGSRRAIDPAREAAALNRAEQLAGTLTGAGRRGSAFSDGWGNQPHTGARGTPPALVRGSPFNPECGEFNCFAVAIAKSRSLATNRPYSARAVRPGMGADVVIGSAEIQDFLGSAFKFRMVRNHTLYTTQELFDHALGMPVRMNQARIGSVLNQSGHGAQGLVFVRVPAHRPRFPGETVGHVFNAYNDNGVVRFVDEQSGSGGMDGAFWFLEATEVWFYEVN